MCQGFRKVLGIIAIIAKYIIKYLDERCFDKYKNEFFS